MNINSFDSIESITIDEYHETRDKRIHPNQLVVDELYTIMFALNRHDILVFEGGKL